MPEMSDLCYLGKPRLAQLRNTFYASCLTMTIAILSANIYILQMLPYSDSAPYKHNKALVDAMQLQWLKRTLLWFTNQANQHPRREVIIVMIDIHIPPKVKTCKGKLHL